jgi:Na+/H+ antiporter NhaD/arsenite permease-like protein
LPNAFIWSIAGLAIAGILFRPKNWPEAVWACLGAGGLVLLGLLPLAPAGAAVAKTGSALQAMRDGARIRDAALIGVELGPNLSVTGSLATILWLLALKREGIDIGAWRFLKLGAIVMPLLCSRQRLRSLWSTDGRWGSPGVVKIVDATLIVARVARAIEEQRRFAAGRRRR